MASIHSDEENNLIYDGSVMYLGANRNNTTGVGNNFEWEDRSLWDYDNWGAESRNILGVDTAVTIGSRGNRKWSEVWNGEITHCLFSEIPVGQQAPASCFFLSNRSNSQV